MAKLWLTKRELLEVLDIASTSIFLDTNACENALESLRIVKEFRAKIQALDTEADRGIGG